MVRYSIIIVTLCVISACSCSKVLEDDMLTLERIQNSSSSLRLDGYYFSEFESDQPNLRIYFLYKNGIILSGSSPSIVDLAAIEEEFRNGEYYNTIKDVKFQWGVYQIEGSEIKFERWYPGERPYEVFLRSGLILSDTTFRITTFSKPDGSDAEVRDELYKFKKFSPRPDSTNIFIE